MATGFEKFSKKAMSEGGISLVPAAQQTVAEPEQTKKEPVEKKEIAKLVTVMENRGGDTPQVEKPAKAPKKVVKAKKEDGEKEETFQMTIVIKMELKRKLDELKYLQRMSYKEIAEEAFEAIYKKYTK